MLASKPVPLPTASLLNGLIFFSLVLALLGANQFSNAQQTERSSVSVADPRGTDLNNNERRPFSQLVWIDDFESPLLNRIGTSRNLFQRQPSTIRSYRVSEIDGKVGGRGYSLCLDSDRQTEGWCGVWIDLRDPKKASPWFDATSFDYISIWLRGAKGTEAVTVRVADSYWFAKQDSVRVARTEVALANGLSHRQWQELRIPISSIRRVNSGKLASIVLEIEKIGKQKIYVDDISFRTEASLAIQLPQRRLTNIASKLPSQSLWVWQTEALINDATARRQLFEFCVSHQIGSIWLQMLYDVSRDRQRPAATIRFPKHFRRLLSEAHAYGIDVHALDGFPEYALNEQQHIPELLVDSLLRFNQQGNGNERFDGVHFDNEPHLLVGWHSPKHRRQILKEFLELNWRCQQKLRGSQMKYGIDIPFWWEEPDPLTGLPCGEVSFRGKTKPASFHCIDMLDNVGIMNYRDQADGADGMIAHGKALLEYAQQRKECEIFMGVETFEYPLQKVQFLIGLPSSEFYRALDGPARKLGRVSRVNNFRIRVFDDGVRLHVGLEQPDHAFDRKLYTESLQWMANQLQLPVQSKTEVGEAANRLIGKLNRSGEYRAAEFQTISSTGIAHKHFAGVQATSFMSPKITFADETFAQFKIETKLANRYFSRYSSFAGMAVHCYDTYRQLSDWKSAAEGVVDPQP